MEKFVLMSLCSLLCFEAVISAVNYPVCQRTGSLCVPKEECLDYGRANDNCPPGQPSHFTCCYSVPKSDKTCGSRGGSCMEKSFRCPDFLTHREATDCTEDKPLCCIFV